MGSPQCPRLPGLCSLVATAPHPVMPLQAQGLTYPSTTSIPIFGVRGGSSVGRAPGLQPGGRGFESHPLHSTSDSMSPAHWLPFLTELADRADELALRWFRAAGLRVADKADRSPVTEADQAIEAMARELVHEHHPQLGVLGEEEGEAAGTAQTRRIIERVERTRGFGDFYQHMLVAEGAGEIAVDPAMHPWDIAALQVIVEEAGGRATSLGGERSIYATSLVTSNGLLQDAILQALRPS